MEIEIKHLSGRVIHDFPYSLENRKCPHTSLVSLTNSGGCIFACPICYARAYVWSEPNKIKIYQNLPNKLNMEIQNLRIVFPLYLSQITDPLQPISEIRKLTFQIIRIIISYRLSFRVVTKCAEGVRELIKEIPELINYPYWFLEMTVETTPQKQVITSPNASKIKERLGAMKFLIDLGIEVVCRTDPTILGIIEPADLFWLIERIKNAGVKHIIASTGYFNKISMENLLLSLKRTKFKDRIKRVIEYYNYHPDSIRKRFMVDIDTRKKFHRWFKNKVEEKGLTYAVCQELGREYDSNGIPTCEGSRRNPVHIRIEKNKFIPIDCSGDCLRFCPNSKSPPCGVINLKTEYPFRYQTILKTAPSLFG
ncbi:MAG: hypothetical protein ABIL70_00490 [candidate division WOR-3 bacterium]